MRISQLGTYENKTAGNASQKIKRNMKRYCLIIFLGDNWRIKTMQSLE